MNNGNREHVSVCKSAPPPQCGLHTQTLSLLLCLWQLPSTLILVDDGIVWISCQNLVVKVEGYSPQSAAFEKAYTVIHDCKFDEKTITARRLVDGGVVWISCQSLVVTAMSSNPPRPELSLTLLFCFSTHAPMYVYVAALLLCCSNHTYVTAT